MKQSAIMAAVLFCSGIAWGDGTGQFFIRDVKKTPEGADVRLTFHCNPPATVHFIFYDGDYAEVLGKSLGTRRLKLHGELTLKLDYKKLGIDPKAPAAERSGYSFIIGHWPIQHRWGHRAIMADKPPGAFVLPERGSRNSMIRSRPALCWPRRDDAGRRQVGLARASSAARSYSFGRR